MVFAHHESEAVATPAPSAPLQPDNTVKLNMISEFTEVSASVEKDMLALATVQGPAQAQRKERAPLSITAVVDKSGSMSGAKLALVQKTLSFVLTQLGESDSLGVVSYDDRVTEEVTCTKATSAGKAQIEHAVNGIRVGGCTNLSGGLLAGIRQQTRSLPPVSTEPSWHDVVKDGRVQLEFGNTAEEGVGGKYQWTLFVRAVGVSTATVVKHVDFTIPTCNPPTLAVSNSPFEVMRVGSETCTVQARITLVDGTVKNFCHDVSFAQAETSTAYMVKLQAPAKPIEAVRSVWLFTDGLANRGETKTQGILDAMQQELAGRACTVFCFGYGSDHNPDMLRALSEAGHGMYSYIPDQAAIPGAFAECLGGLLSVVAKNLKLVLHAQPGFPIAKVYTAFRQEKVNDDVVVHVNDLYSEEKRDVLIKVKVNSLPMAVTTPAPALKCSLTYENCVTGDKEDAKTEIQVSRPAEANVQEIPMEIDQQRNRVETADAIEQAQRLAKEGNMAAAQEQLRSRKTAMLNCRSAQSKVTSALMSECDDLLDCVSSASVYRQRGWHQMAQQEQCHKMQRNACYGNSAQMAQAQQANAYFGM